MAPGSLPTLLAHGVSPVGVGGQIPSGLLSTFNPDSKKLDHRVDHGQPQALYNRGSLVQIAIMVAIWCSGMHTSGRVQNEYDRVISTREVSSDLEKNKVSRERATRREILTHVQH
jgi:hypothetical protein